MKLQEYIAKHGDLEIEEKALNNFLGIKDTKVWKPQTNDIYYYIYSAGNIFENTWVNIYNDEIRYEIGNCFKTREEADFMVERLKVINELKRFAIEHNECEIDWYDTNQAKYFISYDLINEEIVYCLNNFLKHNDIYFTSKEIAMNCVKEIGENRIKKYYLGVVDVEERKE